jgi:hypothetical protein
VHKDLGGLILIILCDANQLEILESKLHAAFGQVAAIDINDSAELSWQWAFR